MERCHGTTKSGERCKRSAPEDSLYCGLHAGQATEEPGEGDAPFESEDEHGLLDTMVVVAAAGIALVAALAFRRVFRFG